MYNNLHTITNDIISKYENGLLSIPEAINRINMILNQELNTEENINKRIKIENDIYKAALYRILKEIRKREKHK